MHGLKSAILAIFQIGLGWPCPVSAALKNASYHLKKHFCFGAWYPERLEGKIRKCSFLKYSKIAVCTMIKTEIIYPKNVGA